MYYHKDTTAQTWTKLNEILKFFDQCPAFNCLQLNGRLLKSYHIFQINSRTIVELNYQVLLSYHEALLRCKRFKRDCRSRSHIWHEINFCSFLRIWYCFDKSHFRKSGSHIIYVALDTFPRIDYWQTSILTSDAKLGRRMNPSLRQRSPRYCWNFFAYLWPLYENRTYNAKWNF